MAGGLFSGSIENMKKYSELFKNKTDEIYNNNWYQIDEAVMTMVHRENEELFDLFYGDYSGIVSNFLSPIHNIDLIIQGCQKMLDHNKVNSAYKVLYYCIPYFENNPNSELVFYFIHLNIITNYYSNNKNLLEKIIDLINLKKNSEINNNREKIFNLLEQNRVNIEYYENKHLIFI
jgi:hypothetical protein